MPAPQASQLSQLIVLKFQSFDLKLPSTAPPPGMPRKASLDYEYSPGRLGKGAASQAVTAGMQQSAGGRAESAAQAMQASVKATAFQSGGLPSLFKPGSDSAADVTAAHEKSAAFRKYIEGISGAICTTWSMWQFSATMVGVVVNAVTASGGQIVGPPWAPLILANAPQGSAADLKRNNVIANVIGTAWLTFLATVKVTGMPWYPAFAAVPSPVAPPAPNIPCPFAALTQIPVAISASILAAQMKGQFGGNADFSDQLFEAIADAFEKTYNLWKVSTMVTNVLATGPVPTFAPPYVPVGPVVGGVGTMTPGGFT